MRILIVEDEERIADFLEAGLQAEGFSTIVARDGEMGIALGMDPEVAVVILDVMLPGMDGHEVLKALRSRRVDLPVLILTALGELGSKVAGLNSGADDYLTKPFAFEELLARLRALLRRRERTATIAAGKLSLDLHGRVAQLDSVTVELTEREFALLEFLMRHPNQTVTRRQILSHVWGFEFEPHSTVLETTMNRLRGKLARPEHASPIETVRGGGYRLTAV